MGMMEKFSELATNHSEKLLAVRNATQFELAEKKGVEFGVWLDMNYDAGFRKIVADEPEILERLAKEETHEAAIKEIETKLYPSNTIH